MKIQEFGRKLSKIVKNLNFAIWKKEFSVIKMKKKQRSSFFFYLTSTDKLEFGSSRCSIAETPGFSD